jgi:hypothetical protein
MNISILHQAALNMLGKPVSIEPDGTMWTGTQDDAQSVDAAPIIAEAQRLQQSLDDVRQVAIEHAKSLGFTDEMIAVMYPNLAP